MRFWGREILGWVLLLLGLFLFYWVLSLLLDDRPKFIQATVMTPIAIFVFRGGIQILKVAVAARLCAAVQRDVKRKDVPRPVGAPKPSSEAIGQEW